MCDVRVELAKRRDFWPDFKPPEGRETEERWRRGKDESREKKRERKTGDQEVTFRVMS